MDKGEFVPDSVMIDVVMDIASPHLEAGQSLLLDGFPRTLEQAEALDEVVNIGIVVNLDIPTDTIVERIADRCVSTFLYLTALCFSQTHNWLDGSILHRVASILIHTSHQKSMVLMMQRANLSSNGPTINPRRLGDDSKRTTP